MYKSHRWYDTTCDQCGKSYVARRSTSKYCSSKCRTRANRQHTSNVNLHNETGRAIEALELLMKLPPQELLKEAVTVERLMTKMMEFQAHYLSGVEEI